MKPTKLLIMKKNLGKPDRIIRLLAGLLIVGLLASNTVALTSTLGIILAVAGTIFLFTGLVNWCAIYALLGLSTVEKEAVS